MNTFLFYHEVYEAHEEYTGFVHEVIDWDGEGPPTRYGTKPQNHVEVRTSPQPTNEDIWQWIQWTMKMTNNAV